MFRCTDCYKEYSEHPGYCECGNDQFEEVIDSEYAESQYETQDSYEDFAQEDAYYDDGYSQNEEFYEQQYAPVPKLKKKKKTKEVRKKELSMMDKVGIGVFALCIVLSILAFIFIGAGKTAAPKDSSGKTVLNKNYDIPDNIDEFWNNALPKGKPSASQVKPDKILNTRLNSIDSELNAYLINLAQAMINAWQRADIKGNGVTQMEFMIKSDGSLIGRKIYKYSGNKTLDNSVGMLINDFGNFQVPPSSYKDEIIIISFSSNNGSLKAYYPNFKVKK